MAPRSSHDVPRNQRGKYDRQRPDGSVVINVPSGFDFVISGASVARTGMGRLLAEGLRHNESLYWTTQSDFEGPEIDQVYCDRIDNPPQRFESIIQEVMYEADELSAVSHTPSHFADHEGSRTYRLNPYEEPHPYSLPGRRDIESTRRQSSCDSPIYDSNYQERARRASQAYGQLPTYDDSGPLHTPQCSYGNLPPPYSSHENPPPYTGTSRTQDEIDNMVPARPRRGDDNSDGQRRRLSLSRRTR